MLWYERLCDGSAGFAFALLCERGAAHDDRAVRDVRYQPSDPGYEGRHSRFRTEGVAGLVDTATRPASARPGDAGRRWWRRSWRCGASVRAGVHARSARSSRSAHRRRSWPAASTVGEILKRGGACDGAGGPCVDGRPPRLEELTQPQHPPTTSGAPTTKAGCGWATGGRLEPLTVTDGFSRYRPPPPPPPPPPPRTRSRANRTHPPPPRRPACRKPSPCSISRFASTGCRR